MATAMTTFWKHHMFSSRGSTGIEVFAKTICSWFNFTFSILQRWSLVRYWSLSSLSHMSSYHQTWDLFALRTRLQLILCFAWAFIWPGNVKVIFFWKNNSLLTSFLQSVLLVVPFPRRSRSTQSQFSLQLIAWAPGGWVMVEHEHVGEQKKRNMVLFRLKPTFVSGLLQRSIDFASFKLSLLHQVSHQSHSWGKLLIGTWYDDG